MDWTRSSLMLACGTLVLVVSSSASARPREIEVRNDVTFSQAIADQPANPLQLAQSRRTDGADSIFAVDDDFKVAHGHTDPKATWDQLMHDDLVGAIVPKGHSHGPHTGALDDPKYLGHSVAPVATIPEPSTYAMMMAGLAGIAVITQRRRRRIQRQ